MVEPVKMPDRIWVWDAHDGLSYGLTESAWARHPYVALTPALSALIEAARDERNVAGLRMAARNFARQQDPET